MEVIAFATNETIEQPLITHKPVTHFMSEKALAKYWLTPEEDIASQDL